MSRTLCVPTTFQPLGLEEPYQVDPDESACAGHQRIFVLCDSNLLVLNHSALEDPIGFELAQIPLNETGEESSQ